MMRLKPLCVAMVLLVLSGSGRLAQAQTGPSGPLPAPATSPMPGQLTPPAVGRLTAANIVAFLRTQPGVTAVVMQDGVAVTIRRENWTYAVNILLYKDGFKLECPLGSIGQRSPAQLVDLLQENDRITMHDICYRFTCWKQNQQLYLLGFNFDIQMSEAQLLDSLVRFTRIIHDTYESWKPQTAATVLR